MLTTAITQQTSSYPETCLIILDQRHTGLVDAIRPEMQNSTGLGAAVEKLLEVNLNNRYGIMLAMEESPFANLNEIEFKRMQVFFTIARRIL